MSDPELAHDTTVHVSVAPGARFDRYEIVRMIGAGGMGNVYEARHTELDKRVALKVLGRRVAGNKIYLERFLREGRIAAKLDHPHVVTVTDVGTFEGKPYLVMEFLQGRDLASLLDEHGRLGVEETVDILLPILAALDVAHKAGLVHRDLKPANIFLARAGHKGWHPKLLDFGIAKPQAEDEVGLTGTADVFGTPQYMAPEQVRRSRDATARSDQYSMGAVLYRCLAGVEAFALADDSVYDLLQRVVSGSCPRLNTHCEDVPEQLAKVVERSMSRLPEQRFRSVVELGAALLPFASPSVRQLWTTTFASAEAEAATLPPPGPGPDETPTVVPKIEPAPASAASAPGGTGPRTLTTASRDALEARSTPVIPHNRPSRPLVLGVGGVLIGGLVSWAAFQALVGDRNGGGPRGVGASGAASAISAEPSTSIRIGEQPSVAPTSTPTPSATATADAVVSARASASASAAPGPGGTPAVRGTASAHAAASAKASASAAPVVPAPSPSPSATQKPYTIE